VYQVLIRLYPRRVREDFGEEMVIVFRRRLDDARTRGLSAVARVWIGEIRSLPIELVRAHRAERPAAAIVAIVASTAAGHLITDAGLFHLGTWAALVTGLAVAGLLYGARLPRQALVLAVTVLRGTFTIDRALLQSAQHRAMKVPGVLYDVLPNTAALANLPKHTPRVRTEIHDNGVITVVRTGGVDGLYILVSLALLSGGAVVGRRLVAT
jgi:hypothetical protein